MIEQALLKAQEGGWKHKPALQYAFERLPSKEDIMTLDCIFTDPAFWQALGNACGWVTDETRTQDWKDYVSGEEREKDWKENWHSFIDHIAEGKDIDSFFKELLK